MREAVTRADAIVRGLLELSADSKTDRQPEDLNACLERSLDLLRYELVATQTAVVRQLATNLPPVLMDRGKMQQVFINLFMNALHAMPNGGTLTVATRVARWSEDLASQESIFRRFKCGDSLAVTEVQDTGTGIPESVLPKVFDPFFKPHLVLLDILMPRMLGGNVAAGLRANAELKAIPIIFLTAALRKSRVAEHEGMISGAPVIAKPASVGEIIECIEKHLPKK